jgi:hypothetical protein
LAALKTISRADFVYARVEAREAGADDAIFLTIDGFLSEATSANLFLVRATTRQRELAVRTALGASRSRIVGHVLGEAAVLGIVGGAAGLLVARMLVAALLAIGPADLPRVAEIGIGWPAAGRAWLERTARRSSPRRS